MGFMKKNQPAPVRQSKCVWCGTMTPENVADCVGCGRPLRVVAPSYQAVQVREIPQAPSPYASPQFEYRAPPPPRQATYQPAEAPPPAPVDAPPPPPQPVYAPPPATVEDFSGESFVGLIKAVEYNGNSFDLAVSDLRIVGAYLGIAGGGKTITGAAIGALLSSGEQNKRARYAGMPLGQVLAADPHNFQMRLVGITKAELKGGVSSISVPRLTMWAGNNKFAFSFVQQNWFKDDLIMAETKRILTAALGPKATFKGV